MTAERVRHGYPANAGHNPHRLAGRRKTAEAMRVQWIVSVIAMAGFGHNWTLIRR
jgi:hypothetical protein